jgi:Ca-activated chloride channel family protein
MTFAAGSAVLVIVFVASAIVPAIVQANPIRNVTEGTLLWRAGGEKSYLPAPVLSTTVEIHVTGVIARAVVRQEFTNPSQAWAEAVYVFPLPENAAVDHLRIQIGDRIIEGVIQERGAAKATYEAAKQEGRRTALVEQERPNVFTTSAANIAPGATIAVEIQYQHRLHYNAGQYRLRFPMVVGPRYVPGMAVSAIATSAVTPVVSTTTVANEVVRSTRASGSTAAGGITAAPESDETDDASRITPPVRHPDAGKINPVSITIDLTPEAPLSRLDSPYHAIKVTPVGAGQYRIELEDGAVPADRDFELVWELVPGAAPTAALFTETVGSETFALLMLTPPAPAARDIVRVPRETIFVIDTSGSMEGASIEQAKAAADLALSRLRAGDSFNVIEFNTYSRSLFGAAEPATPANVAHAQQWVRQLRARGGTEMQAALMLALDGIDHPGRLRQVIFLTDGGVSNESRLFQTIHDRLGDSRLFTIGIGSAVNSHFMTQAAHHGRGTFTYISKIDEVRERMDALFRKIESPVITDVRLELDATTAVDALPAHIPDLYLGEPVVVTLRADMMPVRAVLRGRIGAREWAQEVPLHRVTPESGLSVQWAREKIAALMESRRTGASADEVRQAVVAVALEHHLVSAYTSQVAVDLTPVRRGGDLNTHEIELNAPDGWAVAGTGQGATPATVHLALGTLALLLAAACYGGIRWRSA